MFALVLALTLATEIKPRTPEYTGEDVAMLIKQQNRRVFVDVVKGETSWTDSAMLERNTSFPRTITEVIKSPAPDRKLEAGKVAALIESFDKAREGYVEATLERVSNECLIVAGATRALVNCVYVEYLEARYFKAKFLVRGPVDPVVLLDKKRVRALLMPMQRPDQRDAGTH